MIKLFANKLNERREAVEARKQYRAEFEKELEAVRKETMEKELKEYRKQNSVSRRFENKDKEIDFVFNELEKLNKIAEERTLKNNELKDLKALNNRGQNLLKAIGSEEKERDNKKLEKKPETKKERKIDKDFTDKIVDNIMDDINGIVNANVEIKKDNKAKEVKKDNKESNTKKNNKSNNKKNKNNKKK